MEKLRCLDPDRCHIVKWLDSFHDRAKICMVIELLDISLWDLMVERDFSPLPSNDIRTIAWQVAIVICLVVGSGNLCGKEADYVLERYKL